MSEFHQQPDRFLELPSSWKQSHISFYYAAKDAGKLAAKLPLTPKKLGWMTEVGIYAGNVECSGAETETVMVDCQLVPIPAQSSFSGPVSAAVPLGLIVTEFHALLAYNNRVCGICLLNEQVSKQLF